MRKVIYKTVKADRKQGFCWNFRKGVCGLGKQLKRVCKRNSRRTVLVSALFLLLNCARSSLDHCPFPTSPWNWVKLCFCKGDFAVYICYVFILCVCGHVCMHWGHKCDLAQVEVNGQLLVISSLLPHGCWELNSACQTWDKSLSSLSPAIGSQLGFKNYRKRKCFTYYS